MQEPVPGGLQDRIALVGPTASGKTSVSVLLAERLCTEIVSADSMQVYRRMDIGTAKPTASEQGRTAFHAIDVADPDQEWTLADYQQLAECACREIGARGAMPLLVGGTGLYVRALTTQLDIPAVPPDEEFRRRWREFAQAQGNAALLAEVARIDTDTAARLHVNDIGRQIRALEVYAATGRTLSVLHSENQARQNQARQNQARQNQARQDTESRRLFGLRFADRDRLYERINRRVDQMIADGLRSEVQRLLDAGYSAALKPMQSLGYRHMTAFLAGDCDWDTAVETMKQDTRRFAKRQMIWFRSDPRIHWLEADHLPPKQLADEIFSTLSKAAHTL